MARVNIYLPDDLAEAGRAAGINVSAVTQRALRRELESRATDAWLASLGTEESDIAHEDVLAALDEAREELGG